MYTLYYSDGHNIMNYERKFKTLKAARLHAEGIVRADWSERHMPSATIRGRGKVWCFKAESTGYNDGIRFVWK